jgi:hypothetical protein
MVELHRDSRELGDVRHLQARRVPVPRPGYRQTPLVSEEPDMWQGDQTGASLRAEANSGVPSQGETRSHDWSCASVVEVLTLRLWQMDVRPKFL